MLQQLEGPLRIRTHANSLDAALEVVGQRGERLGHEWGAPAILRIGVGILGRQLLEQLVGLGVVGQRTRIVGVDARQIELGEEPVELRSRLRRLLERGDGNLVVAGFVGAEALLERRLR